jgi:integrase/recombinase XerD
MTPAVAGRAHRNGGSGVIGDYMQHLRRRGYSTATRETYLGILRPYLASCDPATVTAPAIEGWLDGRRLGPLGRYTYVSCIASFHRWALEGGRVGGDPTTTLVRPKVPRRLPRPIATEDLVRAVDTAPARMKVWLSLAAYGGLRCMEIASLRVSDMRYARPPSIHLRSTKGAKDRMVPLAEETRQAIDLYRPPTHGWMFPALNPTGSRTERPIDRRYVSREIGRHLHDQGIPATAHQLRHWFGTEMYRRTRDIKLVGELMGHSQMSTTSLYVALVPSEAAVEAVRTLRALPVDDVAKGEQLHAVDQEDPVLSVPYRTGPDGWVQDCAPPAEQRESGRVAALLLPALLCVLSLVAFSLMPTAHHGRRRTPTSLLGGAALGVAGSRRHDPDLCLWRLLRWSGRFCRREGFTLCSGRYNRRLCRRGHGPRSRHPTIRDRQRPAITHKLPSVDVMRELGMSEGGP